MKPTPTNVGKNCLIAKKIPLLCVHADALTASRLPLVGEVSSHR
jgi:hypothetical protein